MFIPNQKSQAIAREPSRTRHSRCPQLTVIMLRTLLGSQPEIKLRANFNSHDQVKAAAR